MAKDTYKFEIQRGENGVKGVVSSFEVPKDKISTVLEGIQYIMENLDHSVAARFACRMEICGSCGMQINGKPMMACSTIAADLKTDLIHVEPLPHYKVIKDLVVEIDPFFAKYKSVKPYIIRDEDDQKEIRQTPAQFKLYEQFSMCIKCGLCMAACPIEGTDPDYLGPAPLTAILRYNLDNRDDGKKYRLEIASSAEGTSRCHFAGECTEVCPKDVDPSFAIQRLRWQGVKENVKNFFRGKSSNE